MRPTPEQTAVLATLSPMYGKRVVGKQNIIPLVRDAADGARVLGRDYRIEVIIDTEKRRYEGVVLALARRPGHSGDRSIPIRVNPNDDGVRYPPLSEILAFKLVGVFETETARMENVALN